MKPVLQIAAVLTCASAVSVALAAPPKITRLSVRGLQTGATTRIAIQGTDLLPEPKLLVADSFVNQKLVGTPKATAIEFDVTLDQSIAPGVYHLRLATPAGVTPPEIVAIDHLPQHAVATAPNAAPEKLPVAVYGQINGAQVQETKFEGKMGQAVTVDVLAQRLGSKLRPVVTLADSSGRQLASALPVSHLLGDARFEVTLPADGVYTLSVHDLAYAVGTPGHYRLSIGQFDYVDQVYPPVIAAKFVGDPPARGIELVPIELVGRFANDRISKIEGDKLYGVRSEGVVLPGSAVDGGSLAAPLPWPAKSRPIGLRPRVERGSGDLVEGLTLDPSRKISGLVASPGPVQAVSARLLKPGEEDLFHFAVEPGQKWRFDVFGTRLGSPIDASLELRSNKGARLAQNDDAPGTDPRTTVPDPSLEYTVAAGVTEVTAVVTDAYRRGGPEMIYRLVATRLDAPGEAAADFALRLFEDTHLVPAAGSKVLRVEADRNGYNGPIRLMVQGLPAGFTAEPTEIVAGANAALVEIRGPKHFSTGESPVISRLMVVGESVSKRSSGTTPPNEANQMPVRRMAVVGTSPLRTLQPWLAGDVAAAPATYAHELGVDWDDSAANSTALLGQDRKLTVRFRRGPGAVGPIRLTLMTSQIPPIVNGQPNAMQTLRGPAATVDVPLDPAAKQAFDAHAAAEKALATLEAMPAPKPSKSGDTAKPDPKRDADLKAARAKLDAAAKKLREAEAKPTFDYTLTIPADLAMISHDIAIKAELRSLDNQTTLAEAYTPIKHLVITAPLELAVSKEPIAIAIDPKAGATATVVGSIRRLEAFAGDVTLSIAGLPTGITPPREVLKAKTDKFQLAIKVPATFKGKSLDDLRVTATLVPDAKRATVTAVVEAKLPAIKLDKPTEVAAATSAKPAATKVDTPKPAATKPTAAKPPETKPEEAKPAETKPADKKTAATQVSAPKK